MDRPYIPSSKDMRRMSAERAAPVTEVRDSGPWRLEDVVAAPQEEDLSTEAVSHRHGSKRGKHHG